MSTPSARERQWLAARRVAARALHPDRGGDPAAFITALAALDSAYARVPCGRHDPSVIVIVRHPWRRRLTTALSRIRHRTTGTRHRYAHL